MSGVTRPAREDELRRLWPAVATANLMPSMEALRGYWDSAPWRVRVSERGDALLLGAWRFGGDTLAIRGAWAPRDRIPALIDDALAVARAQGFIRVLSPLVAEEDAAPYLVVGMDVVARLVAFSAATDCVVPAKPPAGIRLRPATAEDVPSMREVDALSFDDFWAFGEEDLLEAVRDDHVVVATGPEGRVVAYAAIGVAGSTVTVARLAVSPQYRRRGIALALLADADRFARRRRALGLSLCTQEENAGSRALYASAGFIESTGRYLVLVRAA